MMKFFFSVHNRLGGAVMTIGWTQWANSEHSIRINIIFDFLRKIAFQADLMSERRLLNMHLQKYLFRTT